MSELENIKSLEKYDAWKKAKERRKTYLGLIGSAIGLAISLLTVWLTLKVGPSDIWTLGKTSFTDKEKIEQYIPKIEEIDNKLKNSLLSKPMNWISKKHEEEIAANTHVIGPITISPSLHSSLKQYARILMAVWILALTIVWLIFAWLFYWIIGKYFWLDQLWPKFLSRKEKNY